MNEETVIHHGVTIRIIQDEDPQSPRDWDNLGTMFCAHRRHNLGDKQFESWAGIDAALAAEGKMAVILPLYLFDHSGITIRCSSDEFRAADGAGWDWGQVGYVFVTKEKARKEWGKLTAATLKKIKECLIAEVDAYDKYLTGSYVGWVVEDEDGEHVESCWGYDDQDYALKEAQSMAKSILKRRKLDAKATKKKAEESITPS